MNIEINKKDNSIIEIKGEIGWEEFKKFESPALTKLSKDVEIDGFRKGHVPTDVALKHLGDDVVLVESARLAIAKHYPEIIKEKNIDAIGQPEISLTKIARGNPLGFTISTAVIPEVSVPDYKKIAKEKGKKELITVIDKEVEDFITKIRKDRAHHEMHQNKEEHGDHNPDNIPIESLSPLTDETVKKFGNFENIDDFKSKIKENLKIEKENKAREKNRLQIIEAIIEKTTVSVPEVLIEIEIENMIARFKSDLQNMGLKYEDYLKQVGKGEEAIRNEMKEDAKKRATLQLVVHQIAKEEKIKANKEKLEEEVKKVLEAYKDADETHVRQYLENVLTNKEVFLFLENQNK